MDYIQFDQTLRARLPKQAVLANPGGGTSIIVRYTDDDQVVYQRSSSKFYVSVKDLYAAYQYFRGTAVSSTDLKDYAHTIFDSKCGGHSCNCTFLFMVLKALGIVTDIKGRGRRGAPFYVTIPSDQ